MSKIIQIETITIDEGKHVIYALTDDGRIFWKRSDDDSDEWVGEPLPKQLGGQDG